MDCRECGAECRNEARFCMSCGAYLAPVARLTRPLQPALATRWAEASVHAAIARSKGDEHLLTAGRIPRLMAWLIDNLIVGVAGWLLVAVTGITLVSGEWEVTASGGVVTSPEVHHGPVLLLATLQGAYFVLFAASKWMATPGKRLLDLRIVDADGDRIGIVQSVWRYLCQCLVLGVIVPFAILVVPFGIIVVPIALVMVLSANHRQSPWDMLAGTRVVE